MSSNELTSDEFINDLGNSITRAWYKETLPVPESCNDVCGDQGFRGLKGWESLAGHKLVVYHDPVDNNAGICGYRSIQGRGTVLAQGLESATILFTSGSTDTVPYTRIGISG